MQNTFATWLAYLSEHESLLQELESCLTEEKGALLANQMVLLKEASLRKDKILRLLNDFQLKFTTFKARTATDLGDATLKLKDIISRFPAAEARELETKRRKLTGKSRRVTMLNEFNARCLNTYLDQVGVMQKTMALVSNTIRTYTPEGQPRGNQAGGRLVNRSF